MRINDSGRKQGTLSELELLVVAAIQALPARRGTSNDVKAKVPGQEASAASALKAMHRAELLDRDFNEAKGQARWTYRATDKALDALRRTARYHLELADVAENAVPPEAR